MSNKIKYTVFTPTFNRAYILEMLYHSLLSQSNQDFEWLIVDDGSSDNTEELINKFIAESKLDIRYYKKKNEGKHVAINLGAHLARGKWFFIVDSDDYLVDNALAICDEYCDAIEENSKFAGVVGLKGDRQGKSWNAGNLSEIKERKTSDEKLDMLEESIDCTAVSYRYKYKVKGDRAEVIKTDILRKYPFPVFQGERFMPESYLWYSLSRDGYMFRWFKKVIYIAEYLEDGLTHNGRKLARENPLSRACVDNFTLSIKEVSIKERVKCCINYYRYGKLGGNTYAYLWKHANDKILSIFAIPIAYIYKIK